MTMFYDFYSYSWVVSPVSATRYLLQCLDPHVPYCLSDPVKILQVMTGHILYMSKTKKTYNKSKGTGPGPPCCTCSCSRNSYLSSSSSTVHFRYPLCPVEFSRSSSEFCLHSPCHFVAVAIPHLQLLSEMQYPRNPWAPHILLLGLITSSTSITFR